MGKRRWWATSSYLRVFMGIPRVRDLGGREDDPRDTQLLALVELGVLVGCLRLIFTPATYPSV